MKHYVVTITRQFGSLGRPIAMELAEILDVEYYDRDIVEMTAKEMGLPISVISENEEKAKTSFLGMSYPLGMDTIEKQNKIFLEQRKIIKDIVERESCIIVGRCADAIMQESNNCINVFIYAPYEARLRNCIDTLHMDEAEAKKMITSVDKARDNYHKTYAKFLPGDYRYKQIMIDSSLLGVHGTAKILAEVVRNKFGVENE